MKTLALALAAALAAGLASTPASAQTDAQQIRISYSGLDLTTSEGRAALDLRVLHAARQACGTPSSADLLGRQKADVCLTELRAEAARQSQIAIARAARQAEPAYALSR